MTIQTKHFIDPSDIVAVKFTCKHCGATLSLALSDEKLKAGENRVKNFIDRCPSCSRDWFDFGVSSFEQVITRATANMNRLIELLTSESGRSLGASVLLEIAPNAVPRENKGDISNERR